MAVMAVPVVSACLSAAPRWRVAPDRGDIGMSDPRPFRPLDEDCPRDWSRIGVSSSAADRLNSRLHEMVG